jgi:Uma2 family endonuclease
MNQLHATPYRWSVEEYEELGRAGFFQGDQRVELFKGEIIAMSPIGYRHATAVNRLTKFFVRKARDRFEVSTQNPFDLDDRSQPQPDLCLFDPAVNVQGHHATPDQIFLVIEVSDSSVRYDREDKGPAYAERGIREYWLLNLESNRLEIFRSPTASGYAETAVLEPDATVAPLAFPDLELRVGDFLP